jgi:GntR family transcriptional regulator / MocR family aminotransferase
MRGAYLERRDALLRGLARNCSGQLEVYNADAGLHVTVMLRDGIDDRQVVANLRRRGLAALPLSNSYLGTSRRQGLLLGFGCTTPQRLLDSTRVLGELLKEIRV